MQQLEERCLAFAKAVRDYCREFEFDTINFVYIKQLIRSSSSIGANYIEANENLGPGDLLMHLKISRKEAKETQFCLQLLLPKNEIIHQQLLQEVTKLKSIFSAIILKIKNKPASPNPES